jgi:hypothetical protein
MNDIEKVLAVLNSAFQADPHAIHALMANRVPCSPQLSAHPTVQVTSVPVAGIDSRDAVGALGIINAVVETLTGERVAMVWDPAPAFRDKPVFIGFVKYQAAESRD